MRIAIMPGPGPIGPIGRIPGPIIGIGPPGPIPIGAPIGPPIIGPPGPIPMMGGRGPPGPEGPGRICPMFGGGGIMAPPGPGGCPWNGFV